MHISRLIPRKALCRCWPWIRWSTRQCHGSHQGPLWPSYQWSAFPWEIRRYSSFHELLPLQGRPPMYGWRTVEPIMSMYASMLTIWPWWWKTQVISFQLWNNESIISRELGRFHTILVALSFVTQMGSQDLLQKSRPTMYFHLWCCSKRVYLTYWPKRPPWARCDRRS